MTTARAKAKEQRREELLAAAAGIMAERGFHQTRLGDVGAVVGISGPGLYRHFSGKDELLAEILIDISLRLVEGAQAVVDRHSSGSLGGSAALLRDLVVFHVEFAVTEPDRIRVQDREIQHLDEQAAEKVRSLQRTYLGLWADTLVRCRPELDPAEARLRAQLAAGLINSSRHPIRWAGPDLVRTHATQMALAALDVD